MPTLSLQRKPPEKVRAMAQVVHDNDYVSPVAGEGRLAGPLAALVP